MNMMILNPIERFFYEAKRDFIVLDGALATQLETEGENLNDPLWSAKVLLENSEHIKQVHYEYLKNGADIITTSSYQASFEGFHLRGIDETKSRELFQLSTQLAIQARDEFLANRSSLFESEFARPLVAASIGSYGAFLADGSEYLGDYGSLNDFQLMEFHRKRMEVLVSTKVDLLAFETIPNLREARILLELLEHQFPTTFAWLSFSCLDQKHISSGESFDEAIDLANQCSQIAAVGVNCTDPRNILGLLRCVPSCNHKRLIVYPNSGEQWNATEKTWTSQNRSYWLEQDIIDEWRNAGAQIIGGCCRTTPQDIFRLRQFLFHDRSTHCSGR